MIRHLLSLVALVLSLCHGAAFSPHPTTTVLPIAPFLRHNALLMQRVPVSTDPAASTRRRSSQTTLRQRNSAVLVSFPCSWFSPPATRSTTLLKTTSRDDESPETANDVIGDDLFDIRTTVALIGGQSLLVVGAAVAALVLATPSFGLGPGFALSGTALKLGIFYTLPLGVLAFALDLIEEKFPALQDVTKATNRSVLALLGGSFKPIVSVVTAMALGLAAGVGEEMLFRGVLQFELGERFGNIAAVTVSSIIFGALHAVTPMYAFLASLASVYFGWLYLVSGNLAVPIITHAVYDFGALLFAHWTVSRLSNYERQEILDWKGPMDRNDDDEEAP